LVAYERGRKDEKRIEVVRGCRRMQVVWPDRSGSGKRNGKEGKERKGKERKGSEEK
jgi:hypothetical protein